MASTSIQKDSSSSKLQWTYEVFLSFCGKDTRKNFTSHLFIALKQKGIVVFRDNENLERGEYISHKLLKAIEGSQYAVVVISENYVFSKWCLMELAKIMECMEETRLRVLPVFYHVDPSNVRKQKHKFAAAFALHKEDPEVHEEQWKTWKAALTKVGSLTGWHVHDRDEAIIVEEICETILNGWSLKFSNISKDLVGIESQVREIITILQLELNDAYLIGICGMGGIGKTTLAKVIFDTISSKFHASCFIANIGEEIKNHGLVFLQKQLISKIFGERESNIWNHYEGREMIARRMKNKKVIIVLDDVNGEEQLKELVGSPDWFHQESRIIITSRDHNLLNKYVHYTYVVEVLNKYDALRLFSQKAFKKQHPEENYLKLSMDIMDYAGGLPLAIEVFGSLLFGRTMDEWKSARDLLKVHSNSEVLDKLQISFNGLENIQKKLFLDISFFFKGQYVHQVIDVLTSCGYHPTINIEVLKEKSLIKVFEDKRIWIHDLLVKMSHQIVQRESLNTLGMRSRLWHHKDIIQMLKTNTGTDVIEGFFLKLPLQKQEQLSFEAFSKMKNLRILKINHESFNLKDDQICEDSNNLEWQGDPSTLILSNELCTIEWWGYPLKFLPKDFQSCNLSNLIMPHSCIKSLWSKSKSFDKLKHINLSGSRMLTMTPNFHQVPNLTTLDLSNCTLLSYVHCSIGSLKQLIRLSLRGCKNLKILPDEISLPSLMYLDLNCCLKLQNLPKILRMQCLEELDATGTAISQLPSSIVLSEKLRVLLLENSLENYPNSIRFVLPDVLSGLSSLTDLNLTGRNLSNGALHRDLGCLSSLESLRRLNMSYCNLLDGVIPNDLGRLSLLENLTLTGNKFTRLPDCIFQLCNLCYLVLDKCCSLHVLPKLPLSLFHLSLKDCSALEVLHNQIDSGTLNATLPTSDSAFLVIYFGYDSKPYKMLYLHPQSFGNTDFKIRDVVAWGPTLGSEIPEWFHQRNTNFIGTVQSRLYLDSWDRSHREWGYALFISYQVIEHKNSNPIFPEFSCQLHINGDEDKDRDDPSVPLVFRFPEVPSVGPNGVWVLITGPCFPGQLPVLGCHGASISISSLNVEVKECGACLVRRGQVSKYGDVLTSISPYNVASKIFKSLFNGEYLKVYGPICRKNVKL